MRGAKVTRTTRLGRISPAKAVVFSLVPLLVVVVIGELGLRLWTAHFRTAYERYNYAYGRLELVPNINITARGRELLINSKGFLGPEWPDRKSTGVYRIFALGDSCTFGDGYWARAYPAMLERLLNAANLGMRFEVINAGIEGYNSEYALARVKSELLAYDPDMVVIYVGWNDLMKVNPASAAATGRYSGLARSIERSYLLKAYRKLLFFYFRPLIMSPKPGGDVAELHAFDGFVPLAFQANLSSIVEILQKKRVQPVLLTLPTVVDPTMTAEDVTRQHVVFPYYAGSYSVDRFLSLHRAYNRVIRSTSARYHVPLVDMDVTFNAHDKSDLFWDTMHPSHKGHVLVARSIFETLRTLRLRDEMRSASTALFR
jgi:lysophospholipase L1-like esterase